MRLLEMDRPLVSIDVETTGTNPLTDRIVEVGLVQLALDGTRSEMRWLVNPGCPIPPDATAVHGITDEAVAHAPPFVDIATELAAALFGVDLCGFNLRALDIPILRAEFARTIIPWPCDGARVIDVFHLYRARETRSLTDAVRFYTGRSHEGAHTAVADAAATLDVLRAQLGRYSDLPSTLPELDLVTGGRQADWATDCGRLRFNADGKVVIAFGKNAGVLLSEVDDGFLRWILSKDFPADVKKLARAELYRGRTQDECNEGVR